VAGGLLRSGARLAHSARSTAARVPTLSPPCTVGRVREGVQRGVGQLTSVDGRQFMCLRVWCVSMPILCLFGRQRAASNMFPLVLLVAPSLVLQPRTSHVARPRSSARHGLVVAGPPPGYVDASHILLRADDDGEADALLARIQSGEMSFSDAAAEFSACPSRGKQGSLSTFNPKPEPTPNLSQSQNQENSARLTACRTSCSFRTRARRQT